MNYLEDVKRKIGDNKVPVDGTHIVTSKHGYDPLYYSGKHKSNGCNVQIVANLKEELLYTSDPLPGSIHDSKAVDETLITSVIPANQNPS